MNTPRPYRDERDLPAMLDILVRGRQANNGSYYIHPGDLLWWLYYPPLEGSYWDHIYLWDDPQQPGRCLGWALISPGWVGFDGYTQPELRGSDLAYSMYVWAEEQATHTAHALSRNSISVAWVHPQDQVLCELFSRRGFSLKKGMTQFRLSLDDPLPNPAPPHAYNLRGCRGEPEVAARATAQYGAFKSTAPFDRYQERFRGFMRSPAYEPELDIVAVTGDGQVGAFCIVWTDPVNKVGLFEPVGTHPGFQRKGLGRAVMREGLRRLKQRGMQSAIVSTGDDNLPGISLYQSIGFEAIYQLGTYGKDV